ncbi:hypothetical protein DNTS_030412, partial [Danionella cerebrum]
MEEQKGNANKLDTERQQQSRMTHLTRFAQIPMSKCMRDLCKEEDYSFLSTPEKPMESPKESTNEQWRSHVAELAIQRKAISARLDRLREFRSLTDVFGHIRDHPGHQHAHGYHQILEKS